MSVIQECWINGISTRKMERVFKSFGIEDISAGQVSQVTKELDEEVAQFRKSTLSSFYPVVWIDALYEKIKEDRKVTSKAIMIAMAINSDGQKEILAIEPMDNESTDTWTVFFDRLKARGLQQIGLLVSDAHQGIRTSLKSAFLGTAWQRCKVHFMRNILARIPHKQKEMIGKHLSNIFNQSSYDQAQQTAKEVIIKFKPQFPEAMDCLSDGLEDALQFFHFEELHSSVDVTFELPKAFHRHLRTSNLIERNNQELNRRSRVVRIFPNKDSCLRLMSALLLETHEDWSTGRRFLPPLNL